MAEKQKAAPEPSDTGKVERQDLPAGHPNDPTETTLTQDAAPDEDARAKAVEARVGKASS